MPQPLACHLSSSALSSDGWPRTLVDLRDAGTHAFTCDLADLDRACALVEMSPRLALLGVELCIDVREDSAPMLTSHQAQWLAAHHVMLLVRLSSSDNYDKPSAPRAMPFAAGCVNQLAKQLAPLGLAIALDPRAGCWMQRVEDSVRVAMRVNRANVGVLFNLGDWHDVDGDANLLSERLKLAMPKLMGVTIPVQTLTLKHSEMDRASAAIASAPVETAPMMRLLTLMGYQGPIIRRPVL